jgi:ABC-type transporter Mla maintaining outer membrane lipid asymmetry ATPase subunit MlaF
MLSLVEYTDSPVPDLDATVPVVAFDHVSLWFDDKEVLRDLSFEVRAGHMAILMGPSGSESLSS